MAKSHSPFISITHKPLICNNNGQYLTLIHTNSTLSRGKDKSSLPNAWLLLRKVVLLRRKTFKREKQYEYAGINRTPRLSLRNTFH